MPVIRYADMQKEFAMKYRLGLDLGSTSLGWAVLELNDKDQIVRLADMGVRIFPDGRDAQSHTPVNVERRMARGMRRRTDRIKIRKKRTLQLIHKYGWDFDVNSDEDMQNPYQLRVRALTQKLSSDELGRVMFHLALRRGFKSNRKETRGDAGGKLKKATVALQNAIGDKTLAQFQCESGKYRFSNQFDGNKIKDGAFYPTRDMYLDEFHRICSAQGLADDVVDAFERAIFHQRHLKPVDIGYCMFEPEQLRAYKFEPLFQKWRVLQQVNQLKIIDQGTDISLTTEQRQKLLDVLLYSFNDDVKRDKSGNVKISFDKVKKLLNVPKSCKFNLQTDNRRGLDVDNTAFAFYECGLLDFWRGCDAARQSEILRVLNDERMEDADAVEYLVQNCGLTRNQAETILPIPLEEDVANVSLVAMQKMIPFLENGDLYHVAAEKAGYNHSQKNIPLLDALPYYGDLVALRSSLVADRAGRYRTMNATVHIAMNQIRAVVNGLIDTYGRPCAINIEMGRDVSMGAIERTKVLKEQSANQKENDRIAALIIEMGARVNRENIQRVKLWEQLGPASDRRCVYTDETISKEKLFSSAFEIEHILPFSRTLDDSLSNKTISAVAANRFKRDRAPYEAFTDDKSPWPYEAVWARAQRLPDSVKWRFNRGALEKFLKDSNCIERALNDTRHMTRMAVTYLQHICENKALVRGVPGKMTAMFREMWHLDWWKEKADAEKYRGNHIHHAIDAFVVGCADAGRYQRLQDNAKTTDDYFGKSRDEKRKVWFNGMNVPFDGFDYYDFKMMCENTLISYRKSIKDPAQYGTVGALHEDTAYNLEEFENSGLKAKMSRRVDLPGTDAERKKFQKSFLNINRKTLEMFLNDTGAANEDADAYLQFLDWARVRGIKKVRMIKDEVDIATYVPVFRTKAERNEYHRAYQNWYVAKGIYDGIKDKKLRAAQRAIEEDWLQVCKNAALRAYKWYVGGNNFCADVFEIRNDEKRYPKLAGKWQVAVISNYNAETGDGVPLWRKKYATARRVMTLRINDMVVADFSKDDENLPAGLVETVMHQCAIEQKDTVQVVFRVKKINSDGRIYLRPHFIAKEERDGSKTWGASAGSLQEHNARKVHVSPTGKILK